MKKSAKVIAVIIAVLMIAVMFAGCSGSSGSTEETGYEGTYNSVQVDAFGYTLSGEDAASASLMRI